MTVGEAQLAPLPLLAPDAERAERYREVRERVELLIAGEGDLVAVLATIACELHHAFEYFHWTGFYQLAADRASLVIGPYQGTHGCLRIPLGRGVCGAAAVQRRTQLVPDVHAFPGHIACASSTQSEVVVPCFSCGGDLLGVLDVDSDAPAAFTAADQRGLEELCGLLRAWNVFRVRLPTKRATGGG